MKTKLIIIGVVVLGLGVVSAVMKVYPDSRATPLEVAGEISLITAPLTQPSIKVPNALARSFPNTDFSKADLSLEQAISGGLAKDGIPAID